MKTLTPAYEKHSGAHLRFSEGRQKGGGGRKPVLRDLNFFVGGCGGGWLWLEWLWRGW